MQEEIRRRRRMVWPAPTRGCGQISRRPGARAGTPVRRWRRSLCTYGVRLQPATRHHETSISSPVCSRSFLFWHALPLSFVLRHQLVTRLLIRSLFLTKSSSVPSFSPCTRFALFHLSFSLHSLAISPNHYLPTAHAASHRNHGRQLSTSCRC